MKNFKKITVTLLCVFLLVGCSTGNGGKKEGDKIKVATIINTNLGDKSFADLVWSGVQKAGQDFNFDTKVIELGGDTTKQIPTLTELAESGEWDIIIGGTYNLKESIQKVAEEFPEQKFLVYDTEIDFDGTNFQNSISFMSKQNEGSFLAGALAAMLTTSDNDYANSEKIIGFVGGGENSAINDFLVGYIEGAKYIDPEVKVLFSYVGDFQNTAKAKELALSQYNQGADIIFGVAGPAGLGVLNASKEANKMSIGVDTDSAMTAAETDEALANHIVTSVLKNLDIVIYDLLGDYVKGDLKWGEHLSAGVKEGGMSLAKNQYYEINVAEDIQRRITEIEDKIKSGEIQVSTAIGMSTEEVNAIKKLAE